MVAPNGARSRSSAADGSLAAELLAQHEAAKTDVPQAGEPETPVHYEAYTDFSMNFNGQLLSFKQGSKLKGRIGAYAFQTGAPVDPVYPAEE